MNKRVRQKMFKLASSAGNCLSRGQQRRLRHTDDCAEVRRLRRKQCARYYGARHMAGVGAFVANIPEILDHWEVHGITKVGGKCVWFGRVRVRLRAFDQL